MTKVKGVKSFGSNQQFKIAYDLRASAADEAEGNNCSKEFLNNRQFW